MLPNNLKNQLIALSMDRVNNGAFGPTIIDLLIVELVNDNKVLQATLSASLANMMGSSQQSAVGSIGRGFYPGTPDGPAKNSNKGRK